MLFGFTFALVFIVCLLLSLRRVGSDDDVAHGQKQVTEGLNNEGMPPSLIIFILCLQNCMLFYGYYMHAIFNSHS